MKSFAVLLTLTLPVSITQASTAQTIGGGSDVILRWDGWVAGLEFGYAIAAAGDLNSDGYPDVICSSIEANRNGFNSGGAVVISPYTGTLLFEWFGAAYRDGFGSSVAGLGDINGDGVDDVIIGASETDIGGM